MEDNLNLWQRLKVWRKYGLAPSLFQISIKPSTLSLQYDGIKGRCQIDNWLNDYDEDTHKYVAFPIKTLAGEEILRILKITYIEGFYDFGNKQFVVRFKQTPYQLDGEKDNYKIRLSDAYIKKVKNLT